MMTLQASATQVHAFRRRNGHTGPLSTMRISANGLDPLFYSADTNSRQLFCRASSVSEVFIGEQISSYAALQYIPPQTDLKHSDVRLRYFTLASLSYSAEGI